PERSASRNRRAPPWRWRRSISWSFQRSRSTQPAGAWDAARGTTTPRCRSTADEASHWSSIRSLCRRSRSASMTAGSARCAPKREIAPYLDRPESRQLRPANYPEGAPGRGHAVLSAASGARLGVINLEGRVFMKPLDCPFRTADRLIATMRAEGVRCVLVDMHCEATSEKNAMGHYLDGRVSAVPGAHTHIQT